MLIYVPFNQLRDNPFQKRSEYGDIEELANDIYSHKLTRPDTLGLQQIPNGRLVGDDDGLLVPTSNLDPGDWLDGDRLRPGWAVQLEFGHRRARAFQYLAQNGSPEYHVMPVFVRDLTDEQMLDGVHSENAKRKDISAVEEAELVAEKIALTGRSQKDIAKEWGMGRSTITNLLALLKLPEPVQEANRQGILSARQCGSLATIARIGELADDVEWGDNWDPSLWGAPINPAGYIEKVIENPDDITSDDIREMTGEMLEHAGVEVPDVLATFNCNGTPPDIEDKLIQHKCKGCAWRINQHCLNATCIETKAAYAAERLLHQAAEEFGLPISDDSDLFLDDDLDARGHLREYWQTEAAASDPDLVIGWMVDISAVRPYSQHEWVHESRIWEDDGRRAIAIGHRNPAAIPGNKGTSAPDIANQATRDGWRKQVEQTRKNNVTTAKAHLREVIDTAVADFTPLIALIQPLDAETTDDTSALVDSLVDFLWRRGSVPWSGNAVEEVANLNALLHRAGAEPLPALSFQERAAVALTEWYRVRAYQGEYWLDDKEAAAAAVEVLRREIVEQTFTDYDMLQLSFELDRAAADARRVLGAGEEFIEDDVMETAVSEETP